MLRPIVIDVAAAVPGAASVDTENTPIRNLQHSPLTRGAAPPVQIRERRRDCR